MPTSPTPITSLPTAPSRTDPANFATRADAFLGALPTFGTQANALGTTTYNNAVDSADRATAASTSAGNAATSATNASNSATAAANSATSASNSATSAAASYDAFDDRYLGSKASNPTLDNDGNALLTGALYWNTGANEMRVWNGSAWVASYLPAGAYLQLTGGALSGDLTLNAGTANGVAYLNASKVLTTGSALTFDGQYVSIGSGASNPNGIKFLANGGGLAGNLTFNHSTGEIQNFAATNYFQTWYANNAVAAILNSSGLEIKQSQLIGYSSYAGIGTNGLAVAGNVGIGTSSPATKLDVNGAVSVAGLAALRSRAFGYSGSFQAIEIGARNSNNGNVALAVDVNTITSSGFSGQNQVIVPANGLLMPNAAGTDFIGVLARDASNRLLLGPGTASGITSGNVVIDSSGNLGLGVTPSAWSTTTSVLENPSGSIYSFSGTNQIGLNSNAYYNGTNWIYRNASSVGAADFYMQNGFFVWRTAVAGTSPNIIAYSERARITNDGEFLVGVTAVSDTPNNGVVLRNYSSGTIGAVCVGHASGVVTGTNYAVFAYAGGSIGSIGQSGTTAVLYNTTSDQRLKTNIVDAPEASALIDSIKVRSFDWISDESHQRYGMVAQELALVAPEAVHAPADPNEMMAVDYSKLVPMLIKEIQSLRARVAALEA